MLLLIALLGCAPEPVDHLDTAAHEPATHADARIDGVDLACVEGGIRFDVASTDTHRLEVMRMGVDELTGSEYLSVPERAPAGELQTDMPCDSTDWLVRATAWTVDGDYVVEDCMNVDGAYGCAEHEWASVLAECLWQNPDSPEACD